MRALTASTTLNNKYSRVWWSFPKNAKIVSCIIATYLCMRYLTPQSQLFSSFTILLARKYCNHANELLLDWPATIMTHSRASVTTAATAQFQQHTRRLCNIYRDDIWSPMMYAFRKTPQIANQTQRQICYRAAPHEISCMYWDGEITTISNLKWMRLSRSWRISISCDAICGEHGIRQNQLMRSRLIDSEALLVTVCVLAPKRLFYRHFFFVSAYCLVVCLILHAMVC